MGATTYDQLRARHALDQQLKTSKKIITDHGDLELDEELRAAVVLALRPILEARKNRELKA